MRRAIHSEADAEFADAVGYYAEIAPDLGARFYREMERLIRDVCAYPERFHQFRFGVADGKGRRRAGQ